MKFAIMRGDTRPGRARLERVTCSVLVYDSQRETPELRVNPGDRGWGQILNLAQFEPK